MHGPSDNSGININPGKKASKMSTDYIGSGSVKPSANTHLDDKGRSKGGAKSAPTAQAGASFGGKSMNLQYTGAKKTKY